MRPARRTKLRTARLCSSFANFHLDRTLFLWRLASDVFIKGTDNFHVRIDIAGQHHSWTEAESLIGVIEEPKDDRDAGFLGDAVETGLPGLGPAARSFGRQAKQVLCRWH